MTFSAPDAYLFTSNAISAQDALTLQQEVGLVEKGIRNAANRQAYYIPFDAILIGNPIDDPITSTSLTPLQIAFRDTFITAGYQVSLDANRGTWGFSWASQGIETVVNVYSVRTIVTPSAVVALTETTISNYLKLNNKEQYASISFVNVGAGGDIQEADFGGTNSVFYEYIAIVKQQDKATDLSPAILASLTTSTLGHTVANTQVYKLV